MKKTLSIRTFPIWVAQWQEANFAACSCHLQSVRVSMSTASPSPTIKASALHAPAFFFQGVFPILWATTQNLFPWCARFGKCGRNAVRWEGKKRKKRGEAGTFPSPTHCLMIFVLFLLNLNLKFQAFTVRSARTDLRFKKDVQSPFCWGLASRALASWLCSLQCRHAFNPSHSSTPSVFQDKDHFTNLFVKHIAQSVTCICNTNSKW